MTKLFWSIWWKLNKWKLNGSYPYHIKKMVIIVAPHTSWKDFLVGLAVRSKLKVFNAKFLGKKELFDGPLGWYFKWLGGVPVDRFSKNGMVEQVVEMFNSKEEFTIALSPEGTRKKVDKLRTGFYHIAKQAKVPILMMGFDYSKKEIVIGNPFSTSDDEAAVFRHFFIFFSPVMGVIRYLCLGPF